ncbi:hypothetical protein [Oryzobacter telluris]|uniref:hypothetical protein n=1 Tax=Oryzobacter telluris TaxID=3149179 RepID=UPI00370DC37A
MGIGTVGMEVVQEQLDVAHGSPLGIFMALVAACVVVYGVVASLQAAVCGFLLGHWLDLLRD